MFVYEIGRDEKDLGKHEKIDNLWLDAAEWDKLKLFNDLLAVSPTHISSCYYC